MIGLKRTGRTSSAPPLAKLHAYVLGNTGTRQPCAKRTTCVGSGARTEQVRRAVGESVVAHACMEEEKTHLARPAVS
jgi:hypothetical protein